MQVALPSSADFPPGSLSLLSFGQSSFKIGTCFQNCFDLEAKACRIANICSVLSIFGGQQNDPQMPESKWIIQALNFRVDAWFFKIVSPTTCQMLGMGWGKGRQQCIKWRGGEAFSWASIPYFQFSQNGNSQAWLHFYWGKKGARKEKKH